MVDNRRKDLESTKEELLNQIDELKQQVFALQFEKDVLEKANELLKKDEGITLKDLSNRDKSNTRFYFTPPQILQNALDLDKEKNDIDYYVAKANNVYYSANDEEARTKLKAIERDIIENKIYVNAYTRIIGILFNLYKILLTDDDLERLKGYILSNLDNKCNFDNVKNFYKNDAEFFKNCHALLNDGLSSHKNIKGKLCAHFLESLLDEFQRIHEKLS